MEIILDELIQYTEKKINLIEYNRLSFYDIINKKFLAVKYNNKNIEKIDLYHISENDFDYRDIICLKDEYMIYFFEIDFDFNKLYYIIDNIRNNILLNASNKFRKISIFQKSENFIEIKNHYNFTVTTETNSIKSIKSYDSIKTIYI